MRVKKYLYWKWVSEQRREDGLYEARCKKGNWAVCAASKEIVKREARMYFLQYAQDGEYP